MEKNYMLIADPESAKKLTDHQKSVITNAVKILKAEFGDALCAFAYQDGNFTVDLILEDGEYAGEIDPV
jgi:hypothetical protein